MTWEDRQAAPQIGLLHLTRADRDDLVGKMETEDVVHHAAANELCERSMEDVRWAVRMETGRRGVRSSAHGIGIFVDQTVQESDEYPYYEQLDPLVHPPLLWYAPEGDPFGTQATRRGPLHHGHLSNSRFNEYALHGVKFSTNRPHQRELDPIELAMSSDLPFYAGGNPFLSSDDPKELSCGEDGHIRAI